MTDQPDRQDDGLRKPLERLLAAFRGLMPFPLAVQAVAQGLVRDAETALAAPPTRDGAEGAGEARYIKDIIENAMLTMWNEICSDTGCHPLDIERLGVRKLGFHRDHWARMTAEMAEDQILKLDLAPPKPAPDAMREVAQRLIDRLDYVHSHPAYKAVWEMAQMHHGGYRGPSYAYDLEKLREALSAPVPPADGLSSPAFDRAPHNYGERLPSSDSAANVGETLQSPAVAAEPVATSEAIDAAILEFSDKHVGNHQMILSRAGKPTALAKAFADAILSIPVQPGAGEREAIKRAVCCPDGCQYEGDSEDGSRCYCDTSDYHGSGVEKRANAVFAALSRQAPHSSSEGGR